MVDSHLVMNVLNLMAAQEFKLYGTENALLFALSDYLQQAFQQTARHLSLVSEELRVLQTQLALLAQAGSIELDLKIKSDLTSNHNIGAGNLAGMASHLFSLPDKKYDRKTSMTINLDLTSGPLPLRVVMNLQESPDAEPLDIVLAQRRLDKFLLTTVSKKLEQMPAKWSQQHPQQLELIYFLALGE